MLGGLFSSGSSEEKFWKWFLENKDQIAAINDGNLLMEPTLKKQLKKFDKSLSYELTRTSAGENQFFISTNYIRESIPSVINLANAAPELRGWKIHKFIPRKSIGTPISWNALELNQIDFAFEYTIYKDQAHLRIFIRNYDMKDERHRKISVMFLKAAFGEFDFITKIGALEYVPYTVDVMNKETVKLQELIEIVDSKVR